jgi:transposase
MRYNDKDGFEGDVWDADTSQLEGQYKGVLGASTAQTVRRANRTVKHGGRSSDSQMSSTILTTSR